MRKTLLPLIATMAAFMLFNQQTTAQNTSPYWSLAGNSNATSSSNKLGTTNAYPLRITTNNSTRIYIGASNGYVGIGTTSPSSRLHINSASGTSPFKAQVNGSTKLYVSSGGGLSVGSGSTPPSNGLYVNGRVGIGTATPSYKLHVEGGSGVAIYGNSTGDYGIMGNGVSTGIYGSGGSTGVEGYAPGGLGYGVGVYGHSSYIGVNGYAGSYGVYGTSYNTSGGFGVYGSANTSSGTGVYGTGYYGVKAISPTLYGVDGTGYYIGVIGRGSSSNQYSYGVEGFGVYQGGYFSGSYIGVQGYASGNSGYGIYGSGNSGSYAGYFAGAVYASTYSSSDRKLKQNITDVTSAMDIIGKLQPKSYEYRQDGNFKYMHLPEGTHYGLIAQDLEQVLPNLVKDTKFNTMLEKQAQTMQEPGKAANTTATPQASDVIDFKAVNYTELIPIMIKGMQEQEAENKALKAEVAGLRQMILELKGGAGIVTSAGAYLEQNTPNPVRGSTTIRYHVPEGSTSALLNLTNAKGELVKTISLNRSGSGQVTFNTGMLASGTYNYTLYVDGKQADSKRLLIAK